MTIKNEINPAGFRAVYRSKLADQCAGLANQLSYNDEQLGSIKHTLRECSHFIDSQAVRVERGTVSNARGKSRLMTLRERVAVWLLKGAVEIRP